MSHTDYLVVEDLDEIIVPMQQPTTSWSQLIRKIRVPNENIAGYSFQCVFFKTDWPSDETFMNDTVVRKYDLQTLLKTKRENRIWPHSQRSKMIVIPEKIDVLTVHEVETFAQKGFHLQLVPTSEAMLFHYRNWNEPTKPAEMTEKGMHHFAQDIIKRVQLVHQSVVSKQKH